jgi:lipoprotein-releasing system permease protein
LTLDDIFQVVKVRHALKAHASGKALEVTDWSRDYGDFFETVRMEKMMMFVLLTLIVMIAAFNTVSGLSMMVKDKQAEIAVLRTMGLSSSGIMQVFIVQGSIIGFAGTFFGVLIGIPLAFHVTEVVGFFEDMFGGRMLAGTYFDRVPTDVRLPDIAVIILVSFLISILATLYPAYRAARISPAVALGGGE